MDKDLNIYTQTITKQIRRLEDRFSSQKQSDKKANIDKARDLYEYHVTRVRDFQHERLIHLLVTFFFAGLLLLSAAGGLFVLTLASDPSGPMLNILAWVLCPLLLITELFYVRHYYKLENGTQALYRLTDRFKSLLDI